MKAIVYTQYGPPNVLQLQEVTKPTPKDNEVLVKVHAASLNAAESHLVRGMFVVRLMTGGLRKPKNTIPGADIAGRIEAVGKNVTQFQPGDEVFGDLSASGWGGFAEYVSVPEDAVALKPTNLSFEQAAAVPLAGVTALQGLRDQGQVQPGHRVLVNGAGGGVGSFAVQLARAFGAEVTGVCSTKKVDLVRSLGADEVIDYTQQDFTQNGQRYDLIFDTACYRPIQAYTQALTPSGKYILSGGAIARLFQTMLLGPLMSMTGRRKFGVQMAKPQKQDLLVLKGLLEAGKIVPAIDRCYPLSGVAEALGYFEAGHARGKVVITML